MTQELNAAYEVLEELGRGRFGVVSKCRCRATNSLFAVKSIHKPSASADAADAQCLLNEPKILRHLSSLHASYSDANHLHLILDLFPFPSLHHLLHHHHHFPEHLSRPLLTSLLTSLHNCHSHNVVHRDIKPENILVDLHGGKIQIVDFGSADFLFRNNGDRLCGVFGTPCYVAPEVLGGGEYEEKVDVWSAGVVLYVMLAGFPPFYGETVQEVFEAVLRGNLRFPRAAFRSVSAEARDLLRRMLCRDVSRRFSAEQALRHPWITGGSQTA